MLEQMRRGSKHPVVKGLFFLLALTFVVWGIGDVFRNSGVGYVATVGNSGITSAELDNVVRSEISRYQEMIGKTLSEDEAEKLGIRRYALNQLIRNKLTSTRAQDLGIVAGNKVIAKYVQENEAFFDEKGKFDKQRFQSVLHANGYTEEKYVNAIKRDVSVNSMLETLTIAGIIPDLVTHEVYNFRNETRIADLITLPANSITSVPEPTETDLVQFYNNNQERFSVPEQRALTYVTFNLDKIKSTIKLSDEELKAEYNRSIQQYKTEETRNVEQYLFTSPEEANSAFEKISKGNVKEFATNKIELGKVTKSSAPAEVKDAIFTLKQGEVGKPAKSSLGWHIFIIKAIEAEKTQPFESVKATIAREMITAKASDEFSKFGNQVEDEFAAGKSLEDVANKFELVIHKINTIDSNGNGTNGSKISDIPDHDVFLQTAFNLAQGSVSPLILLPDNASYAIVRADSIIPKRVKALDEVKGNAVTMWKEHQKVKLLQEKAAEIVTKINAGEDAKNLVSKMNLKFTDAKSIKRPTTASGNDNKNGETAIANELFQLKKKDSATTASRQDNGDFVIAILKDIVPTNASEDKNAYKNLQAQLEDEVRNDIMSQYITFLQQKYPVSIKGDMAAGTK